MIDSLKSMVDEPWSERSFAARAELCDSLRRYPKTDDLADMEIPQALGPWRIERRGEHFEWQLTQSPTINDRGAWELSKKKLSGDKGDRIRVVLVGESAAGSFGYWEESTLARQLERKLLAVDDRFEVLDLSCVNASMELCLGVMKCAVTLDPDYYVLYCGNNEGKTLLEGFDSGELNAPTPTAVRWDFLSGSLSGYGASMVAALAAHCSNQLSRAAKIARHFGVKLLYVLPESNTVDWKPQEHASFSLPGQASGLFSALTTEHGVSDASQLQLWQAGKAIAHEQPGRSMALMDAARESGIGAFVNAVPQTVSTVAEALRATCRSEGIEFVDMPALFRGSGERAPDRTRFIDYCHLSLVGIEDVSAAVGRRLVAREGYKPTSDIDQTHRASSREEFLGALVGAIHNYHYGQGREIVAHWVAVALGAGWPGSEDFLDLLRSFLLERPRERFTMQLMERNRAFAELPDRYKLFFLKFVYHGRFDRALVEVIDEVQGRRTLPHLLSARRDDLLAFGGDMYSLFYLDCHQGIRPRLRGSNRTGWERPDMEFLIERPRFEVDIPPTRWVYDQIELELETDESSDDGNLTFAIEGQEQVTVALRANRAQYRFALDRRPDALRRAVFTVDRFVGLADKYSAVDRYRHLGRYGWYPCAGRLLGLRLVAHTRAATLGNSA
jgi:hypothetical protein